MDNIEHILPERLHKYLPNIVNVLLLIVTVNKDVIWAKSSGLVDLIL